MSQLPGRLRADHARERWPNDFYVEPAWAVQRLFDNVRFNGAIHDPCCGTGTTVKVARAYGYEATGADIQDRGFGTSGLDYFKDRVYYENIACNPPYNIGEEFVFHALEFTKHKIAVIMRLPFLSGQNRYKSLYSRRPPAEVLVLSRRPSMPPGGTDVPAKGGTSDYSWLIWDQGYAGPTVLKWAI